MATWTLSIETHRYLTGLPPKDWRSRSSMVFETLLLVATHTSGRRFVHENCYLVACPETPEWARKSTYRTHEAAQAAAFELLTQVRVELEEGLLSPAGSPQWELSVPVPGSEAAQVAKQVRDLLKGWQDEPSTPAAA